jgi:hypothetical protein
MNGLPALLGLCALSIQPLRELSRMSLESLSLSLQVSMAAVTELPLNVNGQICNRIEQERASAQGIVGCHGVVP